MNELVETSIVPATHLALGAPGLIRERFGAKAEVLSRLEPEMRVPHGYALDLAAVDSRKLRRILTEIQDDLAPQPTRASEKRPPLMVRSSATIEDGSPALFPGRFKSVRDCRTVAHLKEAIDACVHHAKGGRVAEYAQAHGIVEHVPLTSVLVQVQIEAEYAGVVFTRAPRPYHHFYALIELIEGPGAALLAGEQLGALYGVESGPWTEHFTQLAGPSNSLHDLTRVLNRVMERAREAERILGESQDLEWVWSGGEIYVVQARPARMLLPTQPQPEVQSVRDKTAAHLGLDKWDEEGQKAAAARYFRDELKRGVPNVQILEATLTQEEIAAELAEREPATYGTVIRFSSGGSATAGLPVGFVGPDDDVAARYVELQAKNETDRLWTGIVSDYMYVQHAFEAFLDVDTAIVEHVPGNWEPENDLRPDVLVFEGSDKQAWKVRERRGAIYELPSETGQQVALLREVEPEDETEIADWMSDEEIPKLFKQLRRRFKEYLPLNFHFVRADGNWHFLNIRPIRDLTVARSHRTPKSEFKRRRLLLVTSPKGLGSWDGVAPVLLTTTPDIADAECLTQLAAHLRDAGAQTVYTSFGVLSHPALVLREFGLEVQPMYDFYELVTLEKT